MDIITYTSLFLATELNELSTAATKRFVLDFLPRASLLLLRSNMLVTWSSADWCIFVRSDVTDIFIINHDSKTDFRAGDGKINIDRLKALNFAAEWLINKFRVALVDGEVARNLACCEDRKLDSSSGIVILQLLYLFKSCPVLFLAL